MTPGSRDDLDRRPDVLVVGGGVIGLATAVFCRRAGVGRVLVIEAVRLAAAASGGAGGALAPGLHQLSDPPAFVALARASLALYRQLEQDWDRALGLEWTAGLLLLPTGPPAGLPPPAANPERSPASASPDSTDRTKTLDGAAVRSRRLRGPGRRGWRSPPSKEAFP